ncbi:MAG: NAD(P)/FAD-dependent oxidoreductase [Thermodesulfobacteriota bacterium]
MSQYDAVIIGGGHNGLILAAYLVRSGLKVAVLEKRGEIGGGLTTEEVTVHGFRHNLHSHFHTTINIMPPYKDLELEKYGACYVCPPTQKGMPLLDGRGLTIHTDIEKTCESLARISKEDARAYRTLYDDYKEFIETAVAAAIYSPPAYPTERIARLETSPEGLDYLKLERACPRDVVNALFQNEAIKALILHGLAIPRGIMDDYYGLGMLVPLIVSLAELDHLCLGGSHVLAHALWRVIVSHGGVVRGNKEVKRIIVQQGSACGVETADGEKFMAEKFIASAIDLKQTFLNLLGEEDLSTELRGKVANYKGEEYSIFGIHLAINEPPRYRSAQFDPALQQALNLSIGGESTQALAQQWLDIRQGKPPEEPCLYLSVPTLFDQTQAPADKHTALIWQPAPYALRTGGASAWDEIKEEYADRCLAKLRQYAPNMDEKNIIARYILTPLDIERKLKSMPQGGVFHGRLCQDQIEFFRPLHELCQYRTPIANLYLCGSSTHPGGGITGAPAYNALQIIAEDLNLTRWWEE